MRNRLRVNRPRSNSMALWMIAGLIAFAVVLLIAGGVGLFLMSRGQLNLPGGVPGLGETNPKVNQTNYDSLRSGSPLSEVEGILGGSGRAATKADLDAICGTEAERYTNPNFKLRSMWEVNNGNGLVRAWSNGKVRILCTFSQTGTNGRLLSKAIKGADGSVLTESGSAFGPAQPAPQSLPPGWPNNNPKNFGKAVNPVAPTWQQMVGTWEVVDLPGDRFRFDSSKVIVKNPGEDEKLFPVVHSTSKDGFFTPFVTTYEDLVSKQQNALFGSFWFEGGTLYNGHQDGQRPTKFALKRVK